ncbi:MAG: hypothetical protein JWQ11_956 [Rhizobacter sp.]|nr:hypothetical protein [Rhizobacter sp.]
MKMPTGNKALGALALTAACAFAAPTAMAASVVDAAGDYVPTYAGSKAGDLDVLSSFVNYDAATDSFAFSATVAAAVGTSPAGFYVWGIDRGTGTERLNTGAIPVGAGVKFDAVVIFRLDGTATVNTFGPVAAAPIPGVVTFAGNTISGTIAGSLLPSTGFARVDYTWNLWPRDGALANNTAISDFAPNASNASVLSPVPEPETYALMALGLAGVALATRRRRGAQG